ncbi:MAG TPA: class I SAM-dependent methyltransferase [Candidatus Ozemobacteraceae bacterium]|nr:class I SAM-dependent methyltransferase [Candidatus Ozemobacteraceae bacterium]
MSPDRETIAFYDGNAATYADASWSQDLTFLLDPFCARLKPGCRVLDLGSGAGRDTEALSRRGFACIALDASAGLLGAHRARGGRLLVQGAFEHLPFRPRSFGGVWACASLLHAPAARLTGILNDISLLLSSEGILAVSLKAGSGESRDAEGRRWTFFDTAGARRALETAGFRLLEELHNADAAGRPVEWISFLATPG